MIIVIFMRLLCSGGLGSRVKKEVEGVFQFQQINVSLYTFLKYCINSLHRGCPDPSLLV